MTSPQLPAPAAAQERRIAPRFQPAFGTICRLGKPDADAMTIGLVWNISETGVSMLLGTPPKAGSVVPAELASESSGQGLAVTLRVIHVRKIQTGDYILGAQFQRRLDADEVRLFLGPQPLAKPISEPAKTA
ncbi:MAG: PilZ domain-containing protein [Gemmataceae bacterium]